MIARYAGGAVAAAPLLLFAFSDSAPPGLTGAPGDSGTCTQCHGGAVNSGGGALAIEAADYLPGQSQTVRVRISDPNQMRWGFSLSARRKSDPMRQAGSFTAGRFTVVETISGIQYASHFPAQQTARGAGFVYELTWTAPDDSSGVVFYASGNAANGNGATSGDNIYAAVKEVAALAPSSRPSVSTGGVVSALAFGGRRSFSSGSWIEIFGANFSQPAAVLINNREAFLGVVTPGQINAQVPEDASSGPVQVVVRSGDRSSEAVTVFKETESPGLLAPAIAPFRVGNRQYLAAVYPPGTEGCPAGQVCFAGNFAGVASRMARPGDRLIVYGIGFGAVAVDGAAPSRYVGVAPGVLNRLVKPVVFRFGQVEARLEYAGLAPQAIGLYQFNLIVPRIPEGAVQLNVTLDGSPIGQTLFLDIAN
ncbi:MAG: hypothetical protein K2X35_00920 [Bryobacteraceae bacterium]|nr:hypothetical protein [Bryobacteraceae bacterium]